ncbi:glycosyltransferase family 2 protein [Pelotalea chapellei]|uniref:Glycosyltransferase family 2 protein n=1 Tax=Pelotalea chapellei TaxID=44671 RepID=A0ABS5U5F4_9BACT|nr:glycosyltransferase family 2 protein [Pelotalea chapellei]MBT1070894.1 glycosyltransferase family 2 protein [Pelotalea chapellei]
MKFIFWLSLAIILYTYIGYPFWLFFLKAIRSRPNLKEAKDLTVSVIIAACNEEQNIAKRIRNVLEQDYPADKLEIIVASDGSTDGTVEAVRTLHSHQVKVLDLSLRYGKAIALNSGVAIATGEIIVFTDCRQTFDPDVIRQLTSNFADPLVGCVSGELVFLQDDASSIQVEMGAYWKYEKWIRKTESATGSVIGATGAIYAIRRELYSPLSPWTLLDDVLTPMNIVLQGFRTVFDHRAVAYDVVSKDVSQEWRRKVRTLAGNWQMIGFVPGLLLPWVNPYWLRFVSHKLFRLLVPFALVILLFSGLAVGEGIYLCANAAQALFYLLCLCGYLLPVSRRLRLVNLIYFFMMMNVAAVMGLWRWLTGGCESTWDSTKVKV